jgi:hypothetical protein
VLTLFSTPKAFDGHFGLIQTNAIESWRQLGDNVEIILFGKDRGTAEICARLGLRHVPDVQVTELGTPLLSDMFAQARVLAKHDLVCYSNADIVLMRDFRESLTHVRSWRRKFLVVGRRCDLDVTQHIDFADAGWESALRARAQREGQQQTGDWIDYFAFARDAMPVMPEFAVGRPGWDNWLLWNTRSRKIAVVDATDRVLAVHQNHDYSHHAGGTKGARHGSEAVRNNALIGTWARMFTIDDANYRLTARGIRRDLSLAYLRRRVEIARRRVIDWSRPIRRRLGLRVLNPSVPGDDN